MFLVGLGLWIGILCRCDVTRTLLIPDSQLIPMIVIIVVVVGVLLFTSIPMTDVVMPSWTVILITVPPSHCSTPGIDPITASYLTGPRFPNSRLLIPRTLRLPHWLLYSPIIPPPVVCLCVRVVGRLTLFELWWLTEYPFTLLQLFLFTIFLVVIVDHYPSTPARTDFRPADLPDCSRIPIWLTPLYSNYWTSHYPCRCWFDWEDKPAGCWTYLGSWTPIPCCYCWPNCYSCFNCLVFYCQWWPHWHYYLLLWDPTQTVPLIGDDPLLLCDLRWYHCDGRWFANLTVILPCWHYSWRSEPHYRYLLYGVSNPPLPYYCNCYLLRWLGPCGWPDTQFIRTHRSGKHWAVIIDPSGFPFIILLPEENYNLLLDPHWC